jgi:hypothetical protein
LTAEIRANGCVHFNGKEFPSCSSAAAAARGSVIGGHPPTNGWTFWKYIAADGKLRAIDFARLSHAKSK